ncbi:DNA topoisomerase [Aphelenchoides besseyi]|nr:DNA topoisomerase [Aphelenchoides besseyi]
MNIPLCRSCILVGNLSDENVKTVELPFQCSHCFGILSDDQLRHSIAQRVREEFDKGVYDGVNFILAVNIPNSMHLRQAIICKLMGNCWNGRDSSPKNLFANLLLKDIEKVCTSRGSLASDLELTVTLEHDEFAASDNDYLLAYFPAQMLKNRKPQSNLDINPVGSKVKVNDIKISEEIAKKYRLVSPTKPCTFSISFQRESIFIGGRYCKDSRSLPQSPWTADLNVPIRAGHSVSEKIAKIMQTFCEASDTRFVASGREDVDVKMLGSGRPFAVQIINARKVDSLKGERLPETLKYLREEINKDPDVSVGELVRVTAQRVEDLKIGQEEKKKTYSALCYTTVPLTDEMIERLNSMSLITITQPTVVRVLKRRPLHDRPRDILNMNAKRIDNFHFQLEVATQAGTYIKEFVHGDFGRTQPSLGTLMGLQANEVDILELDVVAEKPILAESIAKLLSNNHCHTRKGKNGVCSVSEYTGQFKGQRAEFKVTSTCGHVETVDFPGRYNNWNTTDPAELLVCPIEKQEANPKMRMIDYLHHEAKGCDFFSSFEVISACKSAMNKSRSGNIMDNIFRARFSAISAKEINAAMNNLVKPNLNESRSVDARQELDLRVGCAFTRFQTRFFQNKYGDLDSTCISFGPCQTPTLAFTVQRHDLITQFTPEPYYVLKVEVSAAGRSLKLDWQRERIFDFDVATIFLNRIKSIDHVLVDEVNSKNGAKEKPVALNTVELLRIGSSAFGISPATTMSVAEHLYTRGYISYPRTETTAYPQGFDFNSILQQQSGGRFSEIVKKIRDDGIAKPRNGEDKGDHPPITPMRSSDGSLSGDSGRIYDYVVQHFLATLMKPAKYTTQTLSLSGGGEKFSISSRKVIDPGFTVAMPWLAVTEEESGLDQFTKGTKMPIKSVELVNRETSPPGYLTESELISLMEKFGIGTDASIPVHVNNICQRNYVAIGNNRTLLPTKLGIALIHGYQRVDPELIQPNMRAEVETQLNLIAKGKADYETVTNHVLNVFRLKFQFYVTNIEIVDQLFEASFTSLAESGKPFSRCGKCRRFMKLVETRPQRLYCMTCNDTYSLPSAKESQVRLHGERLCPLDNFELLYFHTIGGKLAKSFAFCPFCFNSPPFESMRKGSGCNNCLHPTCPNSLITQGVSMCLNSCSNETGVLVLDPQSGPKWKLSCNRCPSVVSLFEGATKLKVLEKKCKDCGAWQLSAEYKEGKSKLPDNQNSYSGCVFCDHEQKKLGEGILNLNHGYISKEPTLGSGVRGKSRGRGRGGASRGRGSSRGRGKR